MTSPQFVVASDADLDWLAAAEERIHAFPWTRGQFAGSLAAGQPIWLLEAETRLGYAVTLPLVDEIELLNIGVLPEHRRGGWGRALLQHVLGDARERGMKKMFLEVRRSNLPARALYDQAGFEQIAERRNYYPAAHGREDAIIMAKEL